MLGGVTGIQDQQYLGYDSNALIRKVTCDNSKYNNKVGWLNLTSSESLGGDVIQGESINIPVKNSSGSDATINSDKNTRTYKVVIVVPDSADMSTVNTAVSNFKAKNPGVDVEVKTGYGDPTNNTKVEANKTESVG